MLVQKALTQDFRPQFLVQNGSLISLKFFSHIQHFFVCWLYTFVRTSLQFLPLEPEMVAVSAVPFLWAWHGARWVEGVQSVCLEKPDGGEQSPAQGRDRRAPFSLQAFHPGSAPQPLLVALGSGPTPGEDRRPWARLTFSLLFLCRCCVFLPPHGRGPHSCTWP